VQQGHIIQQTSTNVNNGILTTQEIGETTRSCQVITHTSAELHRILDSEIHKEWEHQTATQQDIPTMATVIDFLEARCKALELLQANQSTSTTTYQQSPPERTKVG